METIRVESEELSLPPSIAKRLKGKEVRFVKVDEGYLIKLVNDPIREAKGCLKNKKFSTQSFFRMKREDMALEK
ncbi:MAG: hypothetical protein R6T90_01325 [Dissulfuribacterales bacterium]